MGLEKISSKELTEWQIYLEMEPAGDARGDIQAGIVASTIANRHRDPEKEPQPYEANDFIPQYSDYDENEDGEPKRAGMRPEEMLAIMQFYLPPIEDLTVTKAIQVDAPTENES